MRTHLTMTHRFIPEARDLTPGDMGDVASQAHDKALSMAVQQSLFHLLESEDSKMATGLCKDCGDTIPQVRLDVMPNAVRCTVCQTIEDKRRSRSRRHIGY